MNLLYDAYLKTSLCAFSNLYDSLGQQLFLLDIQIIALFQLMYQSNHRESELPSVVAIPVLFRNVITMSSASVFVALLVY